jgi:CBS domain-containing protein
MGLMKTLRDTEPFQQLPEDLFAEINQAALNKKFPPHTLIFKQHDPPTGYLYLVKEGLVEIVVMTPGGVEMVVDYRQAGAFFGATPVFTNETYTAGARTAKATECYLIPQELLIRAARLYPYFSEHFTRAILSRVRNLYSEMVDDHSQKVLTQMEAYPFKKRLSEIMTSPVETCSASAPVREIARRMTQRGIGALLVCDETRAAGIITKHDLVSKVLAGESDECDTLTAAEVMTPQPFTLPPDAYMFEATAFMMSRKIRHLPIQDQGGVLGMVTLRDLMKYRSQKSMLLIGQVKEARSIRELAEIRAKIVQVAKALLGETRSHFETMEILSYIHHCILRRCFEIVFEETKREGLTECANHLARTATATVLPPEDPPATGARSISRR